MPIYDYQCSKCNTCYDIFHKGKEILADVQCPNCGSHDHNKLISVPGIVTKGSTSSNCKVDNCSTAAGSCCGGSCHGH